MASFTLQLSFWANLVIVVAKHWSSQLVLFPFTKGNIFRKFTAPFILTLIEEKNVCVRIKS